MLRSSLKEIALGLTLALLVLARLDGGQTGLAQNQDALPCTEIVSPGESIQAAVDAAPEGALICLAPGIWRESLVITKNLSLRAETLGTATIWGNTQGRGTPPVVRICAREGVDPHQYAPDVAIENIVVAGTYGWSFGILVGIGAKAKITNCTVAACGSGICIEDGADVMLSGSTIIGNRLMPDPNFIGDGVGIGICGSAQAVIRQCTISGNGNDGIVVADTSKVTIADCTIDGNRFGIALHDAIEVIIEGNRIVRNCHYGVYLFEPPMFTGHIVGKANVIPAPDAPEGNCWEHSIGGGCIGAFYPPEVDLRFLTTQEGGELGRRK